MLQNSAATEAPKHHMSIPQGKDTEGGGSIVLSMQGAEQFTKPQSSVNDNQLVSSKDLNSQEANKSPRLTRRKTQGRDLIKQLLDEEKEEVD